MPDLQHRSDPAQAHAHPDNQQARAVAPDAIAVIGMACHFPGARTPLELWENVLTRRRQFRLIPDCRLPLADYHDPDPAAPDRTTGRYAALIDGFDFDWRGEHIPHGAWVATDPAHWLTLDVSRRALAHAGLDVATLPRERAGVCIGNTLTGDTTRAHAMRLRWPYVARGLRQACAERAMAQVDIDALLALAELHYKSAFPPITEDTLAGSLSNTISGRVCNSLDLHGGGYSIDGACASSLLAIVHAAAALRDGSLDLALAGGVDLSLDPFELVGFAKTGALALHDMRVYDRDAEGFFPAEGCGVVVLKRLADARRDGDTVHAVLEGWGISSDGRGAITAPSRAGQALAIARAWQAADQVACGASGQFGSSGNFGSFGNFGPGRPVVPHFIEGHGTATPVGDRAELEAIATVLDARGARAPAACGVTSLKSVQGHAKAAAGVGGFIKAVMALRRRVLPPTAQCRHPHALFSGAARNLYPIRAGRVLPADACLRAGVSAMGFGGINVHVALRSGDPADLPGQSDASGVDIEDAATPDDAALLASAESAEVLVFVAPTVEQLACRIEALHAECRQIADGELLDLAAALAGQVASGDAAVLRDHGADGLRAAVVAQDRDTLLARLETLAAMLITPPAAGHAVSADAGQVWLGHRAPTPRIGLLYPGQGAQQPGMARVLAQRDPDAAALLARADALLTGAADHPGAPVSLGACLYPDAETARDAIEQDHWNARLADTRVAQPALVYAALLWSRHLERIGIVPSVTGGHSLGELVACWRAGLMDDDVLLCLTVARGAAMSRARGGADAGAAIGEAAGATVAGAMVALGAAPERIAELLDGLEAYVANLNGPRQVVVSGSVAAIDALTERARAAGIASQRLRVSQAFHSPLVADAAVVLRRVTFLPPQCGAPHIPVITGNNGRALSAGADLRAHFADQVTAPVDFVALVEGMRQHCDLLIQVGPGRALTRLVADITDGALPCHSVEARAGEQDDFKCLLARLFVHGVALDWDAVHARRLIRPYVEPSARRFLRNPCEARAGDDPDGAPVAASVLASVAAPAPAIDRTDAAALEQRLFDHIAARTGFARQHLHRDQRLLDDLNLDSIKAADLLAEVARDIGALPDSGTLDLARASIGEIARTLAGQLGGDAVTATVQPEWIHAFAVGSRPLALAPICPAGFWSGARVWLRADPDDACADALVARLEGQGARVRRLADDADDDDHDDDGKDVAGTVAQADAPPVWLIAMMPRGPSPAGAWSPAGVQAGVARLARLAHDALALCDAATRCTVVLVQRSGGDFGAQAPLAPDPRNSRPAGVPADSAPARGFAASLQRETGLPVLSLDLAAPLAPERAADLLLDEAAALTATPLATLRVIGHDARGARCRPDLALLPDPATPEVGAAPPAALLTAGDVVLVSGGARGVTAQCVHAWARRDGLRLVLVGRAGVDDAEVAATLQRLRADGIVARYERCDLTDGAAVAALIATVRADWGRIDAVVHGAGVNHPAPLARADGAAGAVEVGAKLLGAIHLDAALGDGARAPRLFVVLTSVIGLTGLSGNAWYAHANDALDLWLRGFGRRRPACATLALAYGLWSEVGMGARLGATERLATLGMAGLPVAAGVAAFLRWIDHPPASRQVLVTARNPLLSVASGPLPVTTPHALLTELVSEIAGVEGVYRGRLTLRRQPWLADHVRDGQMLLPAVFGLEAMAEAVARVTGRARLGGVDIEDIVLRQPVLLGAVPPGGVEQADAGVRIEVRVVVSAPGRVDARLFSRRRDVDVDHFQASFRLDRNDPLRAPPDLLEALPVRTDTAAAADGRAPLDIRPDEDLYERLLFQGPAFQRLDAIDALDDARCRFRCAPPDQAAADFVLPGDPWTRDALLQAGQACIPALDGVPLSIRRWRLRPAALSGADAAQHVTQDATQDVTSLAGLARIVERGEDRIGFAVSAVDAAGRVVEQLDDYVLKVLRRRPGAPDAVTLAQPDRHDTLALQQALDAAGAALGCRAPRVHLCHRPDWHAMTRARRHVLTLPLLRAALTGSDAGTDPGPDPDAGSGHDRRASPGAAAGVDVTWLDTGQPVVVGARRPVGAAAPIGVSVAHDARLMLYCVGPTPQACDIAVLPEARTEPGSRAGSRIGARDWPSLLGAAHAPLSALLVAAGDSAERAGLRLWAAQECAFKAHQCSARSLTLVASAGAAHRLQARTDVGVLDILTLPMTLTRGRERLFAVVVESSPNPRRVAPTPALTPTSAPTSAPASALAADFAAPPSPGSEWLGVWSATRDADGAVRVRFPVSLREASSPGRGIHFSHWFQWMGRVRELGFWPVAGAIAQRLAGGRWVMITRRHRVVVVADASVGQVIEVRVAVVRIDAPGGSSAVLGFDFYRCDPRAGDAATVLIARGEMEVASAELVAPAKLRLAPWPVDLDQYLRGALEVRSTSWVGEPVGALESLGQLEDRIESDLPDFTANRVPLATQDFDTGCEDGNAVGNLYFANYPVWLGRVRDRWLRGLTPHAFQPGADSEWLCLDCAVEHLREAMPFDIIRVRMWPVARHRHGMRLRFDFLSDADPGGQKLASATQTVLYGQRRASAWQALPLPDRVRQAWRK